MELAGQVTEQFAQAGERRLGAGPDDRERRLVIVADRGGFAQEIGLKTDMEALALLLSPLALDDRTQHLFDRTGYQCGAEHEHVLFRFRAHRAPEIARKIDDRRLVLATVGRGRRSDAD